jgi:hypothetical protein
MVFASILKGSVVLGYYVSLVIILFLILRRRAVPRREMFRIVQATVVVFVISFFLTLQIAYRIGPNADESWAVELPPVIPAAVFVAWSLPRIKRQ